MGSINTPCCGPQKPPGRQSPLFFYVTSSLSILSPFSRCFISISVTYSYELEIGTSTFFREERQTENRKKRSLCGCFTSFLKFCHPTAALPFAFLLGTMSKGNIKSYPPLQPTESKKYVILTSGERVWVIAYKEYSELQIKNLRMGKPSCSFTMLCYWKKTKSQVYEQFLLLKNFPLKLSHMNVGITSLFKKIFSRF